MLNSSGAHLSNIQSVEVTIADPHKCVDVEIAKQQQQSDGHLAASTNGGCSGAGSLSVHPAAGPSILVSIAGQGLKTSSCSSSAEMEQEEQSVGQKSEQNGADMDVDATKKPQTSATMLPTAAGLSESNPAGCGKEKSPMCLVNELTRFNDVQHQYHLIDESGPPHQKTFTVILKLGDEEYNESGPSIRKAQHAAASRALESTKLAHPPPKSRKKPPRSNIPLTPTVELNVLAMKRGQPAIYKVYEPPPMPGTTMAPFGLPSGTSLYDYRGMYNQRYHFPRGLYQASVSIGEHQFNGKGKTAQAARHSAAEEALKVLQDTKLPASETDHGDANNNEDEDTSDEDHIKSPISLVHEIALKRELAIKFEVVSETGPSHMPAFVTRCLVGELSTQAEGNGKKVSKKRAAEQMLEKLRKLPPLTQAEERIDVAGPPKAAHKKKSFPKKKRSSNLIKDRSATKATNGEQSERPNGKCHNPNANDVSAPGELSERLTALTVGAEESSPISSGNGQLTIHPVSRLIQLQQARKEREPQFRVIAERNVDRKKKEFVMECWISNSKSYSNKNGNTSNVLTTVGSGSTKKDAKKKSAESMLIMLGYSKGAPTSDPRSGGELVAGSLSPHSILKAESPHDDELIDCINQGQRVRKVQFVELDADSDLEEAGGFMGPMPLSACKLSGRQLVPGLLLIPTGETKNAEPSETVDSGTGAICLNTSNDDNLDKVMPDQLDAVELSNVSLVSKELLEDGMSATALELLSQQNHGQVSDVCQPTGRITRSSLQLQYLSNVMNSSFQVHFSDIPKTNKMEYLTVVTITTSPPLVCHGLGLSIEESRDAASIKALRSLANLLP